MSGTATVEMLIMIKFCHLMKASTHRETLFYIFLFCNTSHKDKKKIHKTTCLESNSTL